MGMADTTRRDRFAALPDTVRGAFWMSSAALLFALVYVTVRRLSEGLPIAELVLLRALMGIAFMLPWLMRSGMAGLRTGRPGMYVWRTVTAYSGMLCWFYALAEMTLAGATSLMFTMPLFTILLAGMVLQERVGPHRWLATVAGFAGALVIIRPGIIEVGIASLAALYTAMSYAATNIMTKSLTRTESTNAVVFYNFALMAVIAVIPAAIYWKTPVWEDGLWILAFGILSALAQQCVTRAYAAAPASAVSPFNFLKLPFVAVIGFVMFAELPDGWTWAGAALIIASTWYIARIDARRAAMPATAPG